MWESVLEVVKVAGTPILGFIAWRLYRIETNHLPHINTALAVMNTRLDAHIKSEEGTLANILEEVKG